jgi:tRNA 2-thiouridine synthesizing protein A
MGETLKLDCSGLVCPMPVAKTKRLLNTMKSGDMLEVSGDFCEAGENIKRFAENHGGKIINFELEGENYYLKIEKL